MCLYDVDERLLLRRFQVTHNRSLDGVLDSLDSRHVTDAGPLGLIDDSDSDDDGLLPSVAAGPCLVPACVQPVPARFGQITACERTSCTGAAQHCCLPPAGCYVAHKRA